MLLSYHSLVIIFNDEKYVFLRRLSTNFFKNKLIHNNLCRHLAVLDRAHRGYLGFPLSKKRLGQGKQTFYFKGHAMKTAVLSASSVAACSIQNFRHCFRVLGLQNHPLLFPESWSKISYRNWFFRYTASKLGPICGSLTGNAECKGSMLLKPMDT